MKKILLFSIISICFVISVDAAKKDYPLRDAVECNVRGGLPNFYKKIKEGKDITIAYFGGSITSQPGWRVFSLDFFKKQFPKNEFKEVNAAIGGTGSELGVFRMDNDVLKHKPDLIFVEFAVNDGGKQPDQLKRSMEGVVRKTWKTLPETDICFVYTMTQHGLKIAKQGKYTRSATVMEEIADLYNIPTINMGFDVARLETEGKLIFKEKDAKVENVAGKELNKGSGEKGDGVIIFSKDGVHPYIDTGHKLYVKAIIRSLEKIEKAGEPGPHKLPTPMRADNLENSKAYNISKVKLSAGWKKLDPKVDNLAKYNTKKFDEIWVAEQPGETVTFKFKGTKVSLYDFLGPQGGQVSIKIDDKKPVIKRRFDGFSKYNRITCLRIADNLPDTVHTVTMELQAGEFDKFKILRTKYKEDFKKNPKKYEGTKWFVGKIFLVGELVE